MLNLKNLHTLPKREKLKQISANHYDNELVVNFACHLEIL